MVYLKDSVPTVTNMRSSRFIILIFLINQSVTFGQIISGLVTDEQDNPLPFVSIGVVGNNKGTISSINGEFQLNITGIEDSKILRISSVGYESTDFRINDLKQKYDREDLWKISLMKKVYQIDEVILEGKKRNVFFIGSKKKGNTTWAWYNLLNGAEIGRLISNNSKIYLRNFYFHISETNCDSILYRLKIYSVRDHMPDSIVNKEEIFYVSEKQKGWECINLTDNNISLSSDLIITLETINGWNKGGDKIIYLSKIQNKGLSYKRQSSMAPWLKFTGEMSYKLEVSK